MQRRSDILEHTSSENSDIDEDDDYLDDGDQKFEDDDLIVEEDDDDDDDDNYDHHDDDDDDDDYYDQDSNRVGLVDEQLILQVLNSYINRVGRENNEIMNVSAANSSHADLTNERITQIFKQRTRESNITLANYLIRREFYGQKNSEPIRILHNYLPNGKNPKHILRQDSRIFCCRYANDGKTFMTASQDQIIRFYDTSTWKERNMVHARYVSWSIIDTDFSQDQQFFIYSSWSPYIHICNTNGEDNTHVALDLRPDIDERFCIFGLKFSPGGSEILGGSSDGFIYLYDLNASERTLEVRGHFDDINSVTYLDRSGNVFATGSDDFNINIWDKRVIGSNNGGPISRTTTPVGVLTGHTRGVTHVASKEDGTYFITNSKDETTKLWDIRKMSTKTPPTNPLERTETAMFNRYQYPHFPIRKVDKTPDLSIQTYRGHQIRQTLIRCYFSPIETTAQKYIYTGSSDGRIYIYDVLTGEIVQTLYKEFTHRDFGGRLIRDLAWHPCTPEIISTNWNGDIIKWDDWHDSRESFKKTTTTTQDNDDDEEDETSTSP